MVYVNELKWLNLGFFELFADTFGTDGQNSCIVLFALNLHSKILSEYYVNIHAKLVIIGL